MILTRVLEWVRQHGLVPAGSRVVAACSGGPDSLALVDLMQELQAELQFDLQVAHLDHGLRGEESLRDAAFVRDFCAKRRLPFYHGRVDVAAEVAKFGGSIEDTGRRLRYLYLRQVARQVGGALIATGHHRDDQAETVLLNLLRGSGTRGLGGMRPKQADVIRPLLCLSRAELESWCRLRNLSPQLDSSNLDTDFKRNRIRHELLPMLRERYNPSIVDTLCRTAGVLADEYEFVHAYAEEIYPDLVQTSLDGEQADSDRFAALPIALQRELIRCMVEKIQGHVRGCGFVQVERIRELFLHATGTHYLDLPAGLRAGRSYRKLSITAIAPQVSQPWQDCIELQCPGETAVQPLHQVVQCKLIDGPAPDFSGLAANVALFDPAALRLPLWLRCRRPGDRIRVLGSDGGKKIKDLLIDLKVPLAQRDAIPLIGDAEGVLWVVGYRRSDRGKVSGSMKSYIRVEVKPQTDGAGRIPDIASDWETGGIVRD